MINKHVKRTCLHKQHIYFAVSLMFAFPSGVMHQAFSQNDPSFSCPTTYIPSASVNTEKILWHKDRTVFISAY